MSKVSYEDWVKNQGENRRRLINKRDANRPGNKTPSWVNRMKYFKTKDIGATWVRLIPTRPNDPWFSWFSTWLQVGESGGKPTRRQIVSNSHNGELRVPDVLFYYAATEDDPQLLANEQLAITVVDLHDYHKVPRAGKNGRVYHDYVRCRGRGRGGRPGCGMCAEGVEVVFGQQSFWSLYPTAHRDVLEQLEELGSRCASCRTGVLLPVAYSCGSCGNKFASIYDAEIPPKLEDSLRNEEIECKACGKIGRTHVDYECNQKHRAGKDVTYSEGCDNPVAHEGPIDPYGVDLKLSFTVVNKSTVIRVEDFRPCIEIAEELKRPMDLPSFLGKMSLDEQASAMRRENPFGAAEQAALDAYDPLPRSEEDHDSVPWGGAGTAGGDADDDLDDDNDDEDYDPDLDGDEDEDVPF